MKTHRSFWNHRIDSILAYVLTMESEEPKRIDVEGVDSAIIDQRTSERRPPVIEPTFVWVSFDDRSQTRMLDQSQGGISVVAPRTCNFEEGFQIRVEYGGGYRMATIVYINDFDVSRIRVGLHWDK